MLQIYPISPDAPSFPHSLIFTSEVTPMYLIVFNGWLNQIRVITLKGLLVNLVLTSLNLYYCQALIAPLGSLCMAADY